MGDLALWLAAIGFGAFVILPLVCAHLFEKRKRAIRSRRAQENYMAALHAVATPGQFRPTLHSSVGEKGDMLIATDSDTTKIALVPLDSDSFEVSFLPFSDILDITYGEDAKVKSSSVGVIVPVDGLFVGGSRGTVSRSVTSRWLNLFVDDSERPRITLYMPSEVEAQRWFDLIRLGIARKNPELQRGA